VWLPVMGRVVTLLINNLPFGINKTSSATMTQNTNNLAAYIWSLADLLRGDFKQSQYGRIILSFTLLRRLEGVLEDSKEAVLAQIEKYKP
jgi:type I restriction-modification system DNA methylase subunit